MLRAKLAVRLALDACGRASLRRAGREHRARVGDATDAVGRRGAAGGPASLPQVARGLRRSPQAAQQREGDVVLDDLAPGLADDLLDSPDLLPWASSPCGSPRSRGRGAATPHSKKPASSSVVERLEQVDRVPVLLRVDPHDLVADVLVLADGCWCTCGGRSCASASRPRRRGGVPVPGRGVDVRVVHPVPLAVQDVVADLHVLEDLGQPRARWCRASHGRAG